jgi:hypothetical protein
METTLQTATQLVPKEQLPGLISLNPIDVLLTDPERKYRNRMLYMAMILGNGYKSKVKITFHSIDGPRTVETTVWATTDMEAVRPLLEEQGFMLVHVTDEELGKVNGFMAKHPSGITYLLSPKPLAEIGVHTYPTHFVFDKQGTLRFKQTNELNWRTPSTVQDIVKVVE